MDVEATQQFNGAIMFVSFVISVIGSMTTLELLTRRTHIQGKRNWYLLLSAALSMGSVGIWSMHFIGNNSLTLIFPATGSQAYQLAYSGGFTFASLIVSIACMFISFSFVGISEHVQVYRILLSGFFAGIGIAVMHYLGQFAIEYFRVVYKPPYVVGAVIIACTAVTAALWIFFKLREQWMNQWYKRLGCAAIMGVAVCGMHYTAMVGTEYYNNGENTPPPDPMLPTPALIGIICGVVVIACCGLLYAGLRCSMQRMAEGSHKGKRRLVVDLVFFDGDGRMLVDVDGQVPSKEVLSNIQFKGTQQEFSASHPLFARLFQVVTQWSTTPTLEDYDRASHSDEFNTAERRFHEATSSLMESLNLEYACELGLLYESVLKTHTISQPSLFQQQRVAVKHQLQGIKSVFSSAHPNATATHSDDAYALSNTASPTPMENTDDLWSHESKESLSRISFDRSSAIESADIQGGKKSSSAMFSDYQNQHPPAAQYTSRHSSASESEEERHIILVRQLTNNKDIHRFMTQGYRFADATFIATVMAEKLCVPNDYMLYHFRDMNLLAQSTKMLRGPTHPRVMVGLLGLIDEGQTYNQVHMVVDKKCRYGFPLVDLEYCDTGELVRQLLPEEKQCLAHILHDQPLIHMTNIDKFIDLQPRASLAMGRSSTNTMQTMDASLSLASSPASSSAISTSTTIKPTSPTTIPIKNVDHDLFNSQHYQQKQQDHTIQNFALPTSLSQYSTVGDSSSSSFVTQRFARAMEMASRKLVEATGTNGMHLGLSGATLQAEVLDLPAFALTTGSCTLILFRTCLRTRGIVAAIQQHASTEPIRCIPYLLGSSLAYAITQRAVDQYQKSMANSAWATELKQQMLYGSFAHLNHNPSVPAHYFTQHYQQGHSGDKLGTAGRHDYGNDTDSNRFHSRNASGGASSSSSGTNSKRSSNMMDNRLDMITSLPPPPRVKRSRQPPSLDGSDKQLTNTTLTTTNKYQSMNEMESSLIILPAKDRFLWWDQAIVECMHSISS